MNQSGTWSAVLLGRLEAPAPNLAAYAIDSTTPIRRARLLMQMRLQRLDSLGYGVATAPGWLRRKHAKHTGFPPTSRTSFFWRQTAHLKMPQASIFARSLD